MSELQGNSFEVVVNDRAGHAESPLWSPQERALYWVDTRLATIYRIDLESGKRDRWTVPARLGAIGLRRGGLVVASKAGVAYLDTTTGAYEPVVDPEADVPESRINDAKMDRAGRFWFGTMEDDGKTTIGRVYRFDPDRSVRVLDDGYNTPNGFAWSPDNRRLYVSDSRLRTIFVYDFDLASGALKNRRTFAQIPENEGGPDGATVDGQGYLWSSRYGGGRIVRHAPDGSVERTLELPTTHPTNVSFGGDDLRTVFISTAAGRLNEAQLAAQPLAGAVISLRVDFAGIPEPVFGG